MLYNTFSQRLCREIGKFATEKLLDRDINKLQNQTCNNLFEQLGDNILFLIINNKIKPSFNLKHLLFQINSQLKNTISLSDIKLRAGIKSIVFKDIEPNHLSIDINEKFISFINETSTTKLHDFKKVIYEHFSIYYNISLPENCLKRKSIRDFLIDINQSLCNKEKLSMLEESFSHITISNMKSNFSDSGIGSLIRDIISRSVDFLNLKDIQFLIQQDENANTIVLYAQKLQYFFERLNFHNESLTMNLDKLYDDTSNLTFVGATILKDLLLNSDSLDENFIFDFGERIKDTISLYINLYKVSLEFKRSLASIMTVIKQYKSRDDLTNKELDIINKYDCAIDRMITSINNNTNFFETKIIYEKQFFLQELYFIVSNEENIKLSSMSKKLKLVWDCSNTILNDSALQEFVDTFCNILETEVNTISNNASDLNEKSTSNLALSLQTSFIFLYRHNLTSSNAISNISKKCVINSNDYIKLNATTNNIKNLFLSLCQFLEKNMDKKDLFYDKNKMILDFQYKIESIDLKLIDIINRYNFLNIYKKLSQTNKLKAQLCKCNKDLSLPTYQEDLNYKVIEKMWLTYQGLSKIEENIERINEKQIKLCDLLKKNIINTTLDTLKKSNDAYYDELTRCLFDIPRLTYDYYFNIESTPLTSNITELCKYTISLYQKFLNKKIKNLQQKLDNMSMDIHITQTNGKNNKRKSTFSKVNPNLFSNAIDSSATKNIKPSSENSRENSDLKNDDNLTRPSP